MSIRKMLPLATMAVAAVAFAAPAGASAAWHFTDNHEPISETVTTKASGTLSFTAGTGNGVSCTADPEISVGTTSASLTTLGVTPATCTYEGSFAHCELTSVSAGEGTITPVANHEVTVTAFKLTNLYKTQAAAGSPLCPLAGVPLYLTFESVTLETKTNKSGTITTFLVKGSSGGVLETENEIKVANIEAHGSLAVSGTPTISISNVP